MGLSDAATPPWHGSHINPMFQSTTRLSKKRYTLDMTKLVLLLSADEPHAPELSSCVRRRSFESRSAFGPLAPMRTIILHCVLPLDLAVPIWYAIFSCSRYINSLACADGAVSNQSQHCFASFLSDISLSPVLPCCLLSPRSCSLAEPVPHSSPRTPVPSLPFPPLGRSFPHTPETPCPSRICPCCSLHPAASRSQRLSNPFLPPPPCPFLDVRNPFPQPLSANSGRARAHLPTTPPPPPFRIFCPPVEQGYDRGCHFWNIGFAVAWGHSLW